jgi:hypothetical protein
MSKFIPVDPEKWAAMVRDSADLNNCRIALRVKYDENARLKADAERCRLASLRVDVGELHAQFNRALFDETVSENARLKAEVERLTKAGDAMAEDLKACYRAEGYDPGDSETLLKWNAAKEGKSQP